MKSQVLQLRCGQCNHLFESNIPVEVDMMLSISAMKKTKCPQCDGKKIYIGQNRSGDEDDALNINKNQSLTPQKRYSEWVKNGEIGSSAQAIADFFFNNKSVFETPRDISDFRRCALFLRRIPELRPRMEEMHIAQGQWPVLAPRWNELHALFEREVGINLDRHSVPHASIKMLNNILDTIRE